jgi:hypothetical protein
MYFAIQVALMYLSIHQCPTSNEVNSFQMMALRKKSLMFGEDEGDVGAPFGNNKVLFTFSIADASSIVDF